MGGEKRPATSLTARCSHKAELCLCSLTSRRRTRQTQTAEGLQLQERRGGHLLTESLAVVNNGWSDAQAFGSATESRAAQKTKNYKKEKIFQTFISPQLQYLPRLANMQFSVPLVLSATTNKRTSNVQSHRSRNGQVLVMH